MIWRIFLMRHFFFSFTDVPLNLSKHWISIILTNLLHQIYHSLSFAQAFRYLCVCFIFHFFNFHMKVINSYFCKVVKVSLFFKQNFQHIRCVVFMLFFRSNNQKFWFHTVLVKVTIKPTPASHWTYSSFSNLFIMISRKSLCSQYRFYWYHSHYIWFRL